MINKQTVYIPTKVEDELPDESCKTGIIKNGEFDFAYWIKDFNTFDHHKSGVHHKQSEISHWLKPTEAYVFTPEEFEKMLQDYTNRILSNAKVERIETHEQVFIGWGAGRTPAYGNKTTYQVNKESIQKSLPEFLEQLDS